MLEPLAQLIPHRLLRASAGTGKTYQLVEIYVDLVLRHDVSPAEVVVITFTRKAAAVLRQRIRERLTSAGADVRALSALQDAPIHTFHGLCAQLLGQARSDAMAERVSLGDDAEAGERLFVQAAQAAWFGGDASLRQHVETVAPYAKLDESSASQMWQAFAQAREDGRSIDASLWALVPDPRAAQADAHARLQEIRALLQRSLDEGLGKVTQANVQRALAMPTPTADATFAVWASRWRAILAQLSGARLKLEQLSADARKQFPQWIDAVEATAKSAPLHAAWQALGQAAWAAYGAAKQLAAQEDFADWIDAVVHMLRSNSQLRARLCQHYRAVLVDEAQDTNGQQRRLIRLLAGVDPDQPLAERPVIAVGDWKQCIYTFRGADAEAFEHLAADITRLGGVSQTLSHSYRSAPDLVAGINELGQTLFGGRYEPLCARAVAKDAPPTPVAGVFWQPVEPAIAGRTSLGEPEVVAARVAAALAEGTPPGEIAVLFVNFRSVAPAVGRALDALHIPYVTSSGELLAKREEIRDLLALMAWLTDETQLLEAAIALRSPLFGLRDEALWALFRAPLADEMSLGALRKGDPVPAIEASQTESADAVQALHHAATVLRELVALARWSGPWRLLLAIDEALDVRALLANLPGPAQRLANFDRLLTLAAQAERREHQSAASFASSLLWRLAEGTAQEREGPQPGVASDAVSLLSVHSSKGLEFDVVLLAALDRRARAQTDHVFYEREAGVLFAPYQGKRMLKTQAFTDACVRQQRQQHAERKRLLYVAVTRARRQVVLVGVPGDARRGSGFAEFLYPWARHSQTLQQLPIITPAKEPPTLVQVDQPQVVSQTPYELPATGGQPDAVAKPSVAPLLRWTVTDLANHAAGRSHTTLPTEAELAGLSEFDTRVCALGRWREHTARKRGDLVHAMLAGWQHRATYSTLAGYLDATLAHQGIDITSDTARSVRGDLLRWLSTPSGLWFAQLRAAQKRHEWPFALMAADAAVQVELRGQIDLLVWENEAPKVIDFKYAFSPQDQEDPAYRQQLHAYAWAAGKLCQYHGPIDCQLIYLRGGAQPEPITVHTDQQQRFERDLLALAEQGPVAAGPLALSTL